MAKQSTTGIADALIKAASIGKGSGYTRMAADLGVSYQSVQQWVKQGYVPLGRVTEIESIYGVPRHRLVNPKYLDSITSARFDISES